jgi:hypothetical protein
VLHSDGGLLRSLVQCNYISGIRAPHRVRKLREAIDSESENGRDAGLEYIVIAAAVGGLLYWRTL